MRPRQQKHSPMRTFKKLMDQIQPLRLGSGVVRVTHPVEPVTPASNDMRAAKQWKAKIVAQERTIASLQNQIDRVNASIRFTGVSCYDSAQHNEMQVEKLASVQRMQQQLDQQKERLQDMQESARKAGLGSSVYEP